MRDSRHSGLKVLSTSDNRLSGNAHKLFHRILDWRYCTKHAPAASTFALSWRQFAAWYDNQIKDSDTIYAWLAELVTCKYLIYHGRGDRGISIYSINYEVPHHGLPLFDFYGVTLDTRAIQPRVSKSIGPNILRALKRADTEKNRQPDTGKNRQPDTGVFRQLDAGKIPAPHCTYSLREEMSTTKGKKSSRALRGKEGKQGDESCSLRSDGTPPLTLCNGQDAAAVPVPRSHAEDSALSPPDNTSAAARTGGTNPPTSGRVTASRRPLSPEVRAMMDLEKAKFLVKTNALEDLSATHVVALLKAGEKIPEFVCEKFADVVEKFNPVPG